MPHIHDLFDFTVGAVIVHDGSVLFVKHPRYNKWLTPGGHVELDEDPEQTLYREISEETGLKNVTILNKIPDVDAPETKFIPTPNYIDVHEANAPHKHIGLVYFVTASDKNAVLSDEHLDMAWLNDEMLDDPTYDLSPSLKFYAREAMKLAKNYS